MSRLARNERKQCEACRAEMIGAAHVRTGTVAPILLEPSDDGNCLLWRTSEGATYATVGKAEVREYLRNAGVPLRLNHFADCPHAARFTRR